MQKDDLKLSNEFCSFYFHVEMISCIKRKKLTYNISKQTKLKDSKV